MIAPSLFTLIICVDSDELRMQAVLMDHFFSQMDPEFMRILHCGYRTDRLDMWEFRPYAMVQLAPSVCGIYFDGINQGRLQIKYLPNSVTSLRITDCAQRYAVDTRQLPAKLEVFQMPRNFLFGALEMAGLPQSLRELDLSRNKITGPVNFVHLPASIQRIRLNANVIEQERLWFDSLPSKLHEISLEDNGIKGIDWICEDGRNDEWERKIIRI